MLGLRWGDGGFGVRLSEGSRAVILSMDYITRPISALARHSVHQLSDIRETSGSHERPRTDVTRIDCMLCGCWSVRACSMAVAGPVHRSQEEALRPFKSCITCVVLSTCFVSGVLLRPITLSSKIANLSLEAMTALDLHVLAATCEPPGPRPCLLYHTAHSTPFTRLLRRRPSRIPNLHKSRRIHLHLHNLHPPPRMRLHQLNLIHTTRITLRPHRSPITPLLKTQPSRTRPRRTRRT